MTFSFEESAFIQRLKHKNFDPDIEDWWDDDLDLETAYHELAAEGREIRFDDLVWEWDVRVDRARLTHMKKRAYGL